MKGYFKPEHLNNIEQRLQIRSNHVFVLSIKENVNKEWKGDNSKSKKELGLNYRPLKETMLDSFEVLVNANLV